MSASNGWTRVRFGDVATSVSERVDDPSTAGVDRYVGLEHLDPTSLRITRWGAPTDVEATKLRFKAGDVIFGRRRAYQHKVAVADFDGICSAHALVLRVKPAMALPEFLPLFMQSDFFFDRALSISVGSLSPTINWEALARQEFELPPLDEQKRIAELLWAAFDATQARRELIIGLRELGRLLFEDQLIGLRGSVQPFATLWTASPESGYSMVKTEADTGHYVLTLTALSTDGYQPGYVKPVPPVPEVLKARLRLGDFLVSRSNTQDLVGLAGIFSEDRDNVSFPDTMMRVSLDTTLVRKTYAEAVLLSTLGRQHMRTVAAGTSGSMRKINRTSLGTLPFPLPSLDVQDSLVTRIDQFSQTISQEKEQLSRGRALYEALRDKVLSAPTAPTR